MATKEGAGNTMPRTEAVYRDIADETLPDQIESLCMNCEEQGITRLLLVRIPFFKQIILMSFECPHCGFRNNEIQPAGSIEPQGIRLEVSVKDREGLNRQVILGETASYAIPELDFEVPEKGEKGQFTTIEGLFNQAIEGLSAQQPQRKLLEPEVAEKIDAFIARLQACVDGTTPFTFIVTDPSGNSHIENKHEPNPDPDMHISHFNRTAEMNEKLGMTSNVTYVDQAVEKIEADKLAAEKVAPVASASDDHSNDIGNEEVLAIPDNCPSCTAPIMCRIKEISIPHFKSVFIYAHECDACGHRSNEVRTGGAIAEKGLRFVLQLNPESEWQGRDCLKSSSCSLDIRELDLHAMPSTLGGSFTTVEGLLGQVYNQLENSPFLSGDSANPEESQKLKGFLARFKAVMDGTMPATLILEDPSGNSYVQNIYAPDEDPYLVATQYDRTEDDDELLGITDMKTDNYE